MSAAGNARSAARRLVATPLRPWQLALRNYRNKVVYSPQIPRVHRFERAEAVRLAAASEPASAALVATVIVTYRRPRMLLRAVQSALAQSVRDQVILVMDDGGGLPELPADPRLRGYSLSVNCRRPSVLRNIGIRLSRSTYLAFLDDDNEWEPNHLEVALATLGEGSDGEHPDLVYTALRRLFPDGRELDILSTPFDRRLLARHGFIDTNSIVARRCPHMIFSRMQLGDVKPPSDWEVVWRMSRRHAIGHVAVPTVRYLVNPDSYFSDWQGDGVTAEQGDAAMMSREQTERDY